MKKTLQLVFLFLCFTLEAFSQHKISGKVTSVEDGTGLPGVAVRIKGQNKGAITDFEGSYGIDAKNGDVLIFSFLGMLPQSVSVGNQATINVALKLDSKALSEIVVTGTGSATSRRKLGFSVESITSDNIPSVPGGTLDQAMIGKIPGAQISSVSGNPGDKVNIVLRGINTVQAGTQPIILLDGVEIPFENFNQLDMSQVERIEIVQGAASGWLYGAQGANGVIQVFTKKGALGRMKINASSSYAVNSYINAGGFGKSNLHPYLTDGSGNMIAAGSNPGLGYQAGDLLQIDPVTGVIPGTNSIAYRYGTNIPGIEFAPGETENNTRYGILDPRNKSDQPYVGKMKYYDHIKQVFGAAPSINNSISLNGGSEKVDYRISMANNKTYSALLKDNGALDRTNFTSNIGIEVFKHFTIRSITNLAYTTSNMHPNLGAPGGELYGQGMKNANVSGVFGFLNTSPFFDLTSRLASGDYASFNGASFVSVNSTNPYFRLQYTKGDSKRYDIMQNFQANYEVNKFLNLTARYGISFKTENDIWTYYNQSLNNNVITQIPNYPWVYNYNSSDPSGEINNWQYNNTKQNLFTSLNFKTDLQKDFNFKLPIQSSTLLAYDYRKNVYKELDTWGSTVPLTPPYVLTSTQSQVVSKDYVEPFVSFGYVLDQKFEYSNLLGVSGGFRTDYSSAFGAGSKPFTFPHYNGYLNLQNFKFLEGISNNLTQFKIPA